MTDTTGGHRCPECGAPRGADNTPSCDCTRRASDALRDARSAEQAAAEDFDPLRIRPYVDLSGTEADTVADGARTEPLPAVVPPPVPEEAPEPVPVPPAAVPVPARRRTPRWVLTVSAVVAVAGILAVAGLAGGLFSRVVPQRNTAAPRDVREGVPDPARSTGSPSAAAPVTSAAGRAPSVPSASAAASVSPTASPSRTVSASPSGTASRSVAPTRSASTTGTVASPRPTQAPVLRLGDSGAEVTELQQRLAQLRLFPGTADGDYDRTTEGAVRTYQVARGVLTDESGVYGTATRAALESETTKP
ncbi:peptidoglycan-binding protein [Streptomyces sp. NPDC101237]|uniref:peptidoglycan-binding domain-containing protein n=1 Tax=Streptomyces sp. NPDC101237 TaxID=3366139 RepID=UPI003821BC92